MAKGNRGGKRAGVKSQTSKYSTYSAKDLKVGDVIPSTVYKNGKVVDPLTLIK